MKLYAGTSGYSYKEWKGSFYPEDIKPDKMLNFYSNQFSTVEINNTFYRIPQKFVLETWEKQVPKDFRFSIKAPQRITHMKKLNNVDEDFRYFLNVVNSLGNKLGIILFQFPPYFRKNLELLQKFIRLIPGNINAAFEFKHESWFEDDVYSCLNEKDYPLCYTETDNEPEVDITVTASKGYFRLRKNEYSKKEIKNWYDKIKQQNWETVFVYFKHEDEAKGTKYAKQIVDLNKD